ncbi:unnamed protein product [Rotaria sordida]|uniref:Galactose oxidase-like Early set domain-containing protein n=1 Tax=Rotaria sordida TaxID=392033 RepID=A0A815HSX3_9BILA|nr:unnamed protein product [Rotaria sordida]CAF3912392.1 unnamed protein product [Rotaria sordida]
MQTAHAVLLPSGRILLASGSSWRNRGPIETYPHTADPQSGRGIFREEEDPFLINKIEDYYQLVNNVGIYDPSKNTFYRIPHPEPVPDPKWPEHFAPNDFFCTGHLHVPDGNVLFVGGTQYYYPFRTGHRATYLFDWRKEVQIRWNNVDWRRMPSVAFVNDSTNPWIFAGDQRFTGGRGSRKLEQFHASIYESNGGHWTLEPSFLDEHPQDDRTMHYALLLPTSQILIINGANYDFYGSIHYPILLTPQFDNINGTFLGYTKKRMNEGVEARLYHNVALLLPDGRVWISGGGSARATIHYTPLAQKPLVEHNTSSYEQPLPDTSNIDLDVEMFDDGRLAKNSRGSLSVPTETWVAEIFSPPYLFIDGKRRPVIVSLSHPHKVDYQFESVIDGKRYYLLRSNSQYTVNLNYLPTQCASGTKEKLVMIKLGSATHGWDNGQRLINLSFTRMSSTSTLLLTTLDARIAFIAPAFYMMFYVDCMGKPSAAQIIRFDDQAVQP